MQLAGKQSEEQQSRNSFVQMQFIMAMMNIDHLMIKKLLSDKGLFLGYMNAWQFCNWLQNKFSKLKEKQFQSMFTEKISIDIFPGAVMLEFQYASVRHINDIDQMGFDWSLSFESFPENPELTIAFALIYDNGMIKEIRIANRGMEKEMMCRIQNAN